MLRSDVSATQARIRSEEMVQLHRCDFRRKKSRGDRPSIIEKLPVRIIILYEADFDVVLKAELGGEAS
jgi:hypothetical protein